MTGRVRGYASWQPKRHSAALLDKVLGIIGEYSEYLPLTIRQVFYRLVGVHGYDKTERAYKRLGEMINRARRARMIDFDTIRDDGITTREPHCWSGPDELIETFVNEANRYRLDRQAGQSRRLWFAVEAAGLVPLVERYVEPYGITVVSSGGFDSTTAKHAMAGSLAAYQAVEILHIGDHDPSGVHVFSSMAEDIAAFFASMSNGKAPLFTRLAVTPQQVAALGLPTAPAKVTDRRAFDGETTQVEAIPPDVLADIIREAIEARLDRDAYDAVLAEEEHAKAGFRKYLIPALRDLGGEP